MNSSPTLSSAPFYNNNNLDDIGSGKSNPYSLIQTAGRKRRSFRKIKESKGRGSKGRRTRKSRK